MSGSRPRARVLAALATLALAVPAFAQDYTVTNTSGRYVSAPSSGVTTVTSLNGQDDASTAISMPFDFSYFGRSYSTVRVCTNGFAQFGASSSSTFSNTTLPQSGTNDGIVAVHWDDLHVNQGAIRHWSSGTAPNRVFYLLWDGVAHFSNRNATLTFQVQFHETTGKIVTAHLSSSGFYANGYTVGLDEPLGSNRYVYPTGYTGNGNSAFPPDFEYVPRETVFTGQVLFDEIVTTSGGIGATTRTGVVPAGLAVELRDAGNVAASGFVGADGSFTVRGLALVGATTGTLNLSAKSLAANVSPSDSPTSLAPSTAIELASGVSFGSNRAFGTLSVGDVSDADRSGRAALQISRQMEAIRAWVQERTGDVIPQVHVFFSNSSTAGTSYTPAGTSPAYVRIAGNAASNPDAFDPAVVSRAYARHVLASINATDSAAFAQSLDTATSATNALSDAFGLYLFTMTGGGSQAIDGLSASSASVFDLESPSLTRAPAADVGGWAAAALHDLVDGANESHDTIDGTAGTAAERPLAIFDALTALVTPSVFLDEWTRQGFDSGGLVTNFIRHGLLSDDANEPNDSRAAARLLGTAGLRRDGLTLNRFNEDWYRVFVPGSTDAFFVDVTYNRTGADTVIALEVYTPGGVLMATGTPQGDSGPVRAITGPTGPGDVIVRVAHVSGSAIASYGLQAYSRLSITSPGQGPWTVRRPLNQALAVTGVIPPYALSVKQPTQLPRGMLLDSQNLRLTGAPLDEGSITFTIQTTDSGTPANVSSFSQTFKVNAELAFRAPALTGVAVGTQADVDLGRTGGTDPVTVVNIEGNMPAGLTIDPDFHIRGSAESTGGGSLLIEATDVAGSTATVDTTVVSCGAFDGGSVELDAASAAAGFYFDALAGSTANLSLKTAKKRAKRELDVLLLAPGGDVVQGGVVKVRRGKAALKKVPLPRTGRYYLVFSSDDGGDATEILGSDKVALPKKGAGGEERLQFNDQVFVEFGAVAGASFTLKGKTTEDMGMRVLFLILPDGSVLPVTEMVQAQKGRKYTVSFDCPQSGTYGLYLTPKPGGLGDFTYKYKIKQPKGATYTFED